MASQRSGRLNTVLFDLDDTLLDSYGARIHALQTVFDWAKISGLTAVQFLVNLQGAPFEKALNRLAEEQGITNNLFNDYRRVYWNKQFGGIRLHPGIRKMLGTLKSRGYKLGIVSSKFRDIEFEGNRIGCSYELKEMAIADMFSAIIGLEDISQPKPHPEGINLALERLRSSSRHTLFVGDSAADIAAAHNAGCWSCLATWGIKDEFPAEPQADFVVDSPRALTSLDCLK
jgi:pyrophosphatase PpaX